MIHILSPILQKRLLDLYNSYKNFTPSKIYILLMFIDIKFCKFMPGLLVPNKSGERKGEKKCADIL